MTEHYLRVIKPDEYRLMLEMAQKAPKWRKMRDILILRLGFESGLRVGEIAGLKKQKIDFNDLSILIDEQAGEKAPKWKHEALVPISPQTAKDLKESIKYQKEDYVILSTHKKNYCKRPLSTRQIENIVKFYAKKAGLHDWKRVSPHALRRGFATFLDEHLDLKETQVLLRHKSPNTTIQYIEKVARQNRALSKYHKLFKNGNY